MNFTYMLTILMLVAYSHAVSCTPQVADGMPLLLESQSTYTLSFVSSDDFATANKRSVGALFPFPASISIMNASSTWTFEFDQEEELVVSLPETAQDGIYRYSVVIGFDHAGQGRQGSSEASMLAFDRVIKGQFELADGTVSCMSDTKANAARELKEFDDENGRPDLVEEKRDLAKRDVVHLDDVIVDGSACVGLDCVNGESFGFDTLLLKENNLRIHFDDTSNSASFPNVDWRLVANDSSNGGQNRFSVEDASAGRAPFTIEGGAPSNSLYVDDGGRLGLGLSTPSVEIHVRDGDSPALRLEQDGSSGFTPQTWDVAGNETNFFIRDATNGSQLPFRIRPTAPSNAIFINTNGDIGMGTASPAASLHVFGSEASKTVIFETTNETGEMNLELHTGLAARARMAFYNNDESESYQFIANFGHNTGSRLSIRKDGSQICYFADDGTLVSTANKKRSTLREVDSVIEEDFLSKIQHVNAHTFEHEGMFDTHIAVEPEHFHQVFGVGNPEHINTDDLATISLVAIKQLNAKVDELSKRLEACQC